MISKTDNAHQNHKNCFLLFKLSNTLKLMYIINFPLKNKIKHKQKIINKSNINKK